MPNFSITTEIHAPIEDCFDLARNIGFHVRSLKHTNERAIGGRTDGLIELNETTTWQAKHLGMTRRMTVKITAMDRPNHFRDEQTEGPFKRFVHDHGFENLGNGTIRMTDRINFASPYGWLGQAVDRFVMRRYLQRLITKRAVALKSFLEKAA